MRVISRAILRVWPEPVYARAPGHSCRRARSWEFLNLAVAVSLERIWPERVSLELPVLLWALRVRLKFLAQGWERRWLVRADLLEPMLPAVSPHRALELHHWPRALPGLARRELQSRWQWRARVYDFLQG